VLYLHLPGGHVVHEPARGRDRRQLGLVVLCAAMFISAVDSTIVNVALPAISRDLDARVGALQWVIDGFLVCLAGMLLVGSGLADHFGRRKVFLLGLAGFGAASVLAAASQNVAELIATRVLMGAAAACVLPPALSLIAVMFSPEERPRALAVWTAVAGVGFALGPVLGGVLVQSVGWQAVFLVNVPVLVAAVPLGVVSLPESRRPGMPPLDLIGVGLSVIALALVVFALIEGVPLGWSNPAVLAAAAGGFAAGVAFVRVELVRRAPLFDVTALLRPVVATGAIVIVAVYISFLGVLFLLPQYLYYVRHESTLFSGLLLAPLGLTTLVVAPLVPRLIGVVGRRMTVAVGLAAMSAAVAVLLLIHRDTGRPFVVLGAAGFGAMIPVTLIPATGAIMADLGEEKAGDGGAINQLARQVGGALGVAIVGSVFAAVYAHRVERQLAGFSAAARRLAGQSIERAQALVAGTGPELHRPLLARVDHSFDVAARVGFVVAVALLIAAAAAATLGLGSRGRHEVSPRAMVTDA
jgi:EmrB/QacA subfamily drug resistance transporter